MKQIKHLGHNPQKRNLDIACEILNSVYENATGVYVKSTPDYDSGEVEVQVYAPGTKVEIIIDEGIK